MSRPPTLTIVIPRKREGVLRLSATRDLGLCGHNQDPSRLDTARDDNLKQK